MSLTYEMPNGESAQITVVGNEGLVGHRAVYGRRIDAPSRAVVTGAGHGFKLHGTF